MSECGCCIHKARAAGILDTSPYPVPPPLIRCKDCFSGELTCAACCVQNHGHNPLHIVEVCTFTFFSTLNLFIHTVQRWTGAHFEWTTLDELGLCIQLGHSPDSWCFNPKPAVCNFTIIHTNGLHHIVLDFCKCDHSAEAGSQVKQLLWTQWCPATHLPPGTCLTFAVLDLFSMTNLEGKLSRFDFYEVLDKLTDNIGLGTIKVSMLFVLVAWHLAETSIFLQNYYEQFMCIIHKWMFIKMVKWAGSAHHELRIKGTTPGELAIACPTCTHLNINLPDNWEQCSPDQK